jgi:hypothetical protein
MGLDTKHPPLPAPTDLSSADDTTRGIIDDISTDISRVTDKTSVSIPEDGTPVTISTKKVKGNKEQSQTSLLIEYFEGGKSSDNLAARPSVRVRVTPSSRKSKGAKSHIQVSESSKNRQPTYTRRISLPSRPGEALEPTELSQSSNSSGRPPVEVEVFQNSEISQLEDTRFVPAPSDISSIPPDSLLDGSPHFHSPEKRSSHSIEQVVEGAALGVAGAAALDHLTTPTPIRSRSMSKERITQKVMEKLKADSVGRAKESSSKHKSSTSRERSGRRRSVSKEYTAEEVESSRPRSSKDRADEYLRPESSLHPSEISAVSGRSGESARSGVSNTSINNPKLLHAVEDAIKRLILPELNALKEEQNIQKKRLNYEEQARESRALTVSREDSRRLSKSSSLPDVARKPGIITDDRGVLVESPKHRKSRRSSKESDTLREESSHRRSSREKRHNKEAIIAAGLTAAAAGLTMANLKHHDSMSSVERERRKKRTKSHSRTTSMSESIRDAPKADSIPPLPMQSIMDSEVTRDSILSVDTQQSASRASKDNTTQIREHEIREVSRGSPRQVVSPSPRTPTRTHIPTTLKDELSPRYDNISPVNYHAASPEQQRTMSAKAELAAAGVAVGSTAATTLARYGKQEEFEGAKTHHITPARHISPVQSDASYRDDTRDIPMHDRVRSIKSGESMSSSRRRSKRLEYSTDSVPVSPSLKANHRPQGFSLEKGYEILPNEDYHAESPQQLDVDEWFERNHEENERYRSELGKHGHYDPFEESRSEGIVEDDMSNEEHDVRYVGANPEYVHTPVAVESAVASLQEPSTLSLQSSANASPVKEAHLSQADSITSNHGSSDRLIPETRPQTSRERWETIRDQAIASSNRYQNGGIVDDSSRQSTPRSLEERPVMGASALPIAGDEMPEIGMGLDYESEVTTNPSLIQGPIGGSAHGDRSHWPYDPTPDINNRELDVDNEHEHDDAVIGGTATAAIGLGLANAQNREPGYAENSQNFQPTVEDEQETMEREIDSPYGKGKQQFYVSSPGLKDEGYVTAVTPDAFTPGDRTLEALEALDALNTQALDQFDKTAGLEDPFTTTKHLKHESGLSHGMASPLYDAATGKGIDRIQSRDVVALMDHLTVRDAQRNARDTEILVTLVRIAAETRNSFEEMKRFIAEQDRMIMNNTDHDADVTVQRILSGGPRPMPEKSTRGTRSQTSEDTGDIQNKRRNIFRRALKGLSIRNSNDLKNIEDMLVQLLGEVEGLKSSQTLNQAPQAQERSLDSYERLRLPTDPGYEPEGRAGTASTPNQSGYLSNHSSRRLNGTMHSGFDNDRRGSEGHRISTVLEGDEEQDDHTYTLPNVQQPEYNNNERMSSPSQEVRRGQTIPMETPPEQIEQFQGPQSTDETPQTDKSRRHKSTASSLFSGIPKISRWSKTTASSLPESAPPSADRKDGIAISEASSSDSHVNMLEGYEDYELQDDDRIRSQNSLLAQQAAGASQHRSQSPLIPEERRSMEHPKYHAHRNSLNLQHPQPRQGPTHRHQTYLESQAINFEHPPTPEQDIWGSDPTMALNRNRFSGGSGNGQPSIQTSPAYSDHSASEQAQAPARPPKIRDEGPLVPPTEPLITLENNRAYNNYTNQLTSGQMHMPSPLEPIEEVRYSLETDRNSEFRQAMTPSPHPTTARAMQNANRKITGPREMPQSSSSVRRKPVQQERSNASPASGRLSRLGFSRLDKLTHANGI